MATETKFRRGTTGQHSTFTGASGEITVDTTKITAVVHDGVTLGGVPLLRASGTQNIVTTGNITGDIVFVTSYTVGTVPSAAVAAGLIYVTDDAGGATMAFSDGTNWRRVSDRTIVAV
jgi:hypothetical protein